MAEKPEEPKDVQKKLKTGEYKSVAVDPQKYPSPAWNNFYRVHDGDDKPLNFAQCKSCKLVVTYSHAAGTNGIGRHPCCKNATAAVGTSRISAFCGHPKLPIGVKQRFVKDCAVFVAQDIRPYNIVSGPGFTKLIQSAIKIGATIGNVDASELIPHRTTVADSTRKLSVDARTKVSCHDFLF